MILKDLIMQYGLLCPEPIFDYIGLYNVHIRKHRVALLKAGAPLFWLEIRRTNLIFEICREPEGAN